MSDATSDGFAPQSERAQLEEVAVSAEAARDALIRLSKGARNIIGVRVNFARSIELLEQLSNRARRLAFRLDGEADESLVRSLTASLAALQATGSPLGPDKSEEIEREIRRALARENGARGGKKMTERKRAALARLHARRREALARSVGTPEKGGDVKPEFLLAEFMGDDENVNNISSMTLR